MICSESLRIQLFQLITNSNYKSRYRVSEASVSTINSIGKTNLIERKQSSPNFTVKHN